MAYRGSRCKTPFILNLCVRWTREVSITPHPLYPRERTPVLVEYEAGRAPGSPNVSEKRKIFWPCRNSKPAASPSRILVIIPTDLPRLSTNHVCWHKRPSVYQQIRLVSQIADMTTLIYDFLRFRSGADGVYVLLVCYATSMNDWRPTFRDIHVVSSSVVETSKGLVPVFSLRCSVVEHLIN